MTLPGAPPENCKIGFFEVPGIMTMGVYKLVRVWAEKGKQERDVFSKFIFYYFCFNALTAHFSQEDRDRAMLNWIYANDNPIKTEFGKLVEANDYFQNSLTTLKGYGKVYDNRKKYQQKFVEVKDIKNINEVLDVVYQIRCNLFHGSKSPSEVRDQKLASTASRILGKLVGCVLANNRP